MCTNNLIQIIFNDSNLVHFSFRIFLENNFTWHIFLEIISIISCVLLFLYVLYIICLFQITCSLPLAIYKHFLSEQNMICLSQLLVFIQSLSTSKPSQRCIVITHNNKSWIILCCSLCVQWSSSYFFSFLTIRKKDSVQLFFSVSHSM